MLSRTGWTYPIEGWLGAVAVDIGVASRRRGRFLEELRAHLEDATQRFQDSGLERYEAEQQAVHAMGSPESIAEAFCVEASAPSVLTRAGGAGLVLAGVLAALNLRWRNDWLSQLLGGFLTFGVVALYLRQRYLLSETGRHAFLQVMVYPLVAFLGLITGALLVGEFLGSPWPVSAALGLGLLVATVAVIRHRLVPAQAAALQRVLVPFALAMPLGLLAPLLGFLLVGVAGFVLCVITLVGLVRFVRESVHSRVLPLPLMILTPFLLGWFEGGSRVTDVVVAGSAIGTALLGAWLVTERAARRIYS